MNKIRINARYGKDKVSNKLVVHCVGALGELTECD